MTIFNEYIDKFSQFVGDEEEGAFEESTLPNPDMEDSIQLDTINAVEDSMITEE